MYDQYKETFIEEAYEMLGELEINLLRLEETPEDEDLIRSIFRDFHTIKGSGQMFGFDDVAKLTHEVETIFDMVRSNELSITNELINLALSTRDQINKMIDASANNEVIDNAPVNQIIELLKRHYAEPPSTPSPSQHPDPSCEPDELSDRLMKKTYHIHFKPERNIFANGTDPILLLNELFGLGTGKLMALGDGIPPLDSIEAEECYLYWDIILTTDQGIDAINDIFIFLDDDNDIDISVIDENGNLDDEETYEELIRILREYGFLLPELLKPILDKRKQTDAFSAESDHLEEMEQDYPLPAKDDLKGTKAGRQAQKQEGKSANIRVSLERLDSLMDLVGEMVIAQARLRQVALDRKDVEVSAVAEEIERLSNNLRDKTMNIRMIPLGTTFSRFKRLVRDLSQELGKDIVMTTQGGDTELDKTVIERLNDPLVHIIRNCVDHAIEKPEDRKKAGKPGQGTVSLSAAHSGAEVLIEIADDGAGLNKEAILAKAVSKGLVQPEAEPSDQEIFKLIFEAGFSTAKQVTNVSGRGVGMDVVRSNIEALRGAIDIESKKGEGTTITLKLPLTLAIIDGLLVDVGKSNFIFPLAAVQECLELSKEKISKSKERNILNLNGEAVPYLRLRELFKTPGDLPEIERVVVAEVNNVPVAFVVDRVINLHQTVIKALGRAYRDVEGVSGATIMGDGTVALILDLPKLVKIGEAS